MKYFAKKLSPARVIAFGFAAVILIGSWLLMLPCSTKNDISLNYIDALYTSASAVCVTGLVTIDVGTTFSAIGQFFVALLIQIGGLGVVSIGAGIIIAIRKRINLRGGVLIREASNLESGKGTIAFVKSIFFTTVTIEIIGAVFSFFVFSKDYPTLEAVGHSLFHSIASFNNSGFDNLGLSGEVNNNVSLIAYKDNVLLNLVTCSLIFFGGIGFLVIKEITAKHFKWKKFSMHTKVVLSVSVSLIIIGTVLIKLTEDISWMGALFCSVSTRTAGFSTYSISNFSTAGLLLISFFMLIGASPGSTGGGIKTTTFFVLLQGIKSAATNKSEKAFKYSIPANAFKKSAVITLLALGVIVCSTYLLVIFEPQLQLIDALFEMISAFGTVGLSTGITPTLGTSSKLLSILIMYIGRLGPLTVATLWYFNNGERAEYPEGNIAIG